jgi:hypothetical protein
MGSLGVDFLKKLFVGLQDQHVQGHLHGGRYLFRFVMTAIEQLYIG